VLRGAGVVACRRDGMNVCYSVADPSAFEVCRLVCDTLARQADVRARELRQGVETLAAAH